MTNDKLNTTKSGQQASLQELLASPLYQYHQLTKHTVDSLLNNSDGLDWANQPNPFREYAGAKVYNLPNKFQPCQIGFFALLDRMHFLNGIESDPLVANELPSAIEPAKLDSAFLSNLLFFSMSISAWKQIKNTDHRWALRVNPSSGNLHPTETHLALSSGCGLPEGLYHYRVKEHALEHRCGTNSLAAIDSTTPSLVLSLTSIFWREAWKYRRRAFRYCQHDLGHALAAISLSAAILGWRTEINGQFNDSEIADRLGLSGSDEKPMLLITLHPANSDKSKSANPLNSKIDTTKLTFAGTPNSLSTNVITYQAIEDIYAASKILSNQRKPLAADSSIIFKHHILDANTLKLPHPKDVLATTSVSNGSTAQQLIRSRRSCLSLDGQQRMSIDHLSAILWSASRGFKADFCADNSFIHLFAYLHRIDGIFSGLYCYDKEKHQLLQLVAGDARQAAKIVSCFQDIAADGCLAVSMVANLAGAYNKFSDRSYRYVHYQAGYIGQMLYLSSLALGYESTGIGCFVDDEINHLLKLEHGHEVVYNFTIGKAVSDPRLTDLPAYDFLTTR